MNKSSKGKPGSSNENEEAGEVANEAAAVPYTIKINNRYSWLIIGSVSSVIIVSLFIIIFLVVTERKFEIDVAIILTTLLAFFSIFLSSFFYFKATEQSNQFYDRSYNHTRDIAKTLSAMEGKFGEALKNIEHYSTRLNERFDNLPFINNSLQEDVLGEAQKNIQELLEKMEVGEVSKDEIKEFEEKFSQIQDENIELKKKINKNKNFRNKRKFTDDYYHDIALDLLSVYGKSFLDNMDNMQFSKMVKEIVNESYDENYINNLVNHGIFDIDSRLTAKGLKELKLTIKYLMHI
ncbi:hypothetical protein [Sporosarcina sp. FA9]|uniref:hypothetical protein n=1 Tax=Sporosarcina sp. FA9 TaxID=3413030 RepID=UPI003F65B5DC